jgi:molybdopterin/thiamine biosynthesis adenylyltransferase
VEEQNLPRQLLYNDRDIGVRKAFAAATHLERFAPHSTFLPVDIAIESGDDVARLVRRYRPDLVVCAADRPPLAIKGWVDDGAFALGVPVLHGGSRPPFVYAGPLLVPGQTSCYECFYASRVEPGSEELEAAVNVRRNEDPPGLPAVGWADVTAASLCAIVSIAEGATRPMCVVAPRLRATLRKSPRTNPGMRPALGAGCPCSSPTKSSRLRAGCGSRLSRPIPRRPNPTAGAGVAVSMTA